MDEMKIFREDNFTDKKFCDEILQLFLKHETEPSNGERFFNDRIISYNQTSNRELKKLLNIFRYSATFKARQLFNKILYPEYTNLVYWPNGFDMGVHADAVNLDGTPAKYPWRHSAVVMYLNDNYKGGETYFPLFNYDNKPATGSALFFPSDLTHQHGVRKVSGQRYTLAAWFTEDPDYIELDYV